MELNFIPIQSCGKIWPEKLTKDNSKPLITNVAMQEMNNSVNPWN